MRDLVRSRGVGDVCKRQLQACAEWAGNVLFASDSRRSCGWAHLGPRDEIEDGRGDAFVLRWPAFSCSRAGVRSERETCSWRRVRVVVVVGIL